VKINIGWYQHVSWIQPTLDVSNKDSNC